MALEQIQICKVDKNRVVLPPMSTSLRLFEEKDLLDLLVVIQECINNAEQAWFFRNARVSDIPLLRASLVHVGRKTLRERLIEGYKAKAEEDLEIANEFVKCEAEADEHIDKERRHI